MGLVMTVFAALLILGVAYEMVFTRLDVSPLEIIEKCRERESLSGIECLWLAAAAILGMGLLLIGGYFIWAS